MDLTANADRFGGFAELYDEVRPTPPHSLAELLGAYAGGNTPGVVVDLGSGSGLSTRWCATWAGEVIGVEPSTDMRSVAERSTTDVKVRFVPGWAHETGLPDASADMVVAVQALHWMEPVSTFAEIGRILRPGGVFAAIDCDWPPAIGSAELEEAWEQTRVRIRAFEVRLASGLTGDDLAAPVSDQDVTVGPQFGRDQHHNARLAAGVRSWSKDGHLARMRDSGVFRWSRELTAHSVEPGDGSRFVDLLRSQGDFQTLLKHRLDEDQLGVTELVASCRRVLGDEGRSFWFSWRARVGVVG